MVCFEDFDKSSCLCTAFRAETIRLMNRLTAFWAKSGRFFLACSTPVSQQRLELIFWCAKRRRHDRSPSPAIRGQWRLLPAAGGYGCFEPFFSLSRT